MAVMQVELGQLIGTADAAPEDDHAEQLRQFEDSLALDPTRYNPIIHNNGIAGRSNKGYFDLGGHGDEDGHSGESNGESKTRKFQQNYQTMCRQISIMDKAAGWDNQPAWDAGWKDVQYKSAGEAWNDSVRNSPFAIFSQPNGGEVLQSKYDPSKYDVNPVSGEVTPLTEEQKINRRVLGLDGATGKIVNQSLSVNGLDQIIAEASQITTPKTSETPVSSNKLDKPATPSSDPVAENSNSTQSALSAKPASPFANSPMNI
ncbi:MAG TPA: hypothetical protein PLE43_04980 [Alphaproteobacteria bacterium]|nr:hypothetical protein [Alphaproteobacteria bacterium]